MNCEQAKYYLNKAHYHVVDIEWIPEGSNHKVFIVTLEDKGRVICKFPVQRHTEKDHQGEHRDTLFGGLLSLDREEYIYDLARLKGHVPAPKVYGHHTVDGVEFMLTELMPGKPFSEWIESENYSKSKFLDAMKYLAIDFANIQKISFDQYGDIMKDHILPKNKFNFVDRFSDILMHRINKGYNKLAFTDYEKKIISKVFTEKLASFRTSTLIPTMVFTDMHADNFFVDALGQPSGYFDLESSQAAPAALEFYGFRFFLFNYFDKETMLEAEKVFFTAYEKAGGLYAPKSDKDHELIDFLSACRLLELTESYWAYEDGLRDLWALKIKNLLMDYLFTNTIDYIKLSDIFREKTKQPESPN